MKKEEIIAIIDECEEILVKINADEDYATGVLINLERMVEKGDVLSAVKLAVIAAFLVEN